MAGRIRTIKPELIEDEKTSTLSHFEFRLFVSLILLADDYGNLRAEPKFLAGNVFWGCPESAGTVLNAINALAEIGLLKLYCIRKQNYAHLVGWAKHQRVDKPGKPHVPSPALADFIEVIKNSRDIRETLAPDQRPTTNDQRPTTPTCTSLPDPATPSQGLIDDPASLKFDFEAVYRHYPRKEGKKKGLQRCKTQITTQGKFDLLVRAVGNYAAKIAVESDGDNKYAKHFDSFMNCWEDYIDYQPVKSKKKHVGYTVLGADGGAIPGEKSGEIDL